jgi:CheY-like chemotaxis protein
MSRPRILIAEDNKRDAATLTRIANQYGISISVDSFQALRETLEEKTNWDLLILDLSMPGTDPDSTVDAICLMRLTMPIIVVTGTGNPSVKQRCESMAWTWIDKDSDRFDAAVHHAIRSSVSVDESGESFRVQPSNSKQLEAIRMMLEEVKRQQQAMDGKFTELAETVEEVLTYMFGEKDSVKGRKGGGCADTCKATRSIFDAGKTWLYLAIMGTSSVVGALFSWLASQVTK